MLNSKKWEVNLYEIRAHFIHEIKTKGYDFIGVNVFLPKLMKFLPKKIGVKHPSYTTTITQSFPFTEDVDCMFKDSVVKLQDELNW